MAIDSYMFFKKYDGTLLSAESQVDMGTASDPLSNDLKNYAKAGQLFEVEDYSFDTEQVFNLSSQSTGIGAGKITLNPFSITRKIDKSSPFFYQMSCNGTPFQQVGLALRKGAGTGASGVVFLRFDFKLVGVKTISYSHDDESPKETVTFVYGAMVISYAQQKSDGTFYAPLQRGWNQQKNTTDDSPNTPIAA
jgi:type VI protein secretion system component Hcp